MKAPPLHHVLREETLVGPFSKTSDPNIVEAMGRAGMSFAVLDLEHGPNDIVNLLPLIQACQCTGMYSVVRVLRHDQIGRVLDLGADAVQIPHVNTAKDAELAVHAARFSPLGNRGVCRYVRAAGHSATDKAEYFRHANDVTVIAQVEGKEGLMNLDAIIDVKGIDAVFVGVYDLSQSLGITGQVNDPQVVSALGHVVAKCAERGIPVGTFVESPETALQYSELGVSYLCYAVDTGLIYEQSRMVVSSILNKGHA